MIVNVTIPARLLTDGEHVVVSTRTHVKVLLGPLAVLLVTVFAATFTAARVSRLGGDLAGFLDVGVAAVAAGIVLRYVVRPFLTWYTTTYTFTNRRFVARSGLLAREGRTIPLNRISGVDYEVGVVDRLLGCGTLLVSDTGGQGRVPLRDIPRVEEVQTRLAEVLHWLWAGEDRSEDGG